MQFASRQSTREDSARDHAVPSVMDMEALVFSSISLYHFSAYCFGCKLLVSPSHLTALTPPPPLVPNSAPHVRNLRWDPPPPPLVQF